jgi:hypothetical protein
MANVEQKIKVGQNVYVTQDDIRIFEGKITEIRDGYISYTYIDRYGQTRKDGLVGGNIEYFGIFTTKQQAKDYLLKKIDKKRSEILKLKNGGSVKGGEVGSKFIYTIGGL